MTRTPISMDLNVKKGHEGYHLVEKSPAPVGYRSYQQVTAQQTSNNQTAPTLNQQQQQVMKQKQTQRAMAIATKPGSQIAMNAVMMYMSGSSLNMFSINVVTGAILSPLTSLLTLQQTFGIFHNVDLTTPKAIFVALNLVWLGVGLYKMSSMRLLPTTAADFAYKVGFKDVLESTSVPPDNLLLL